jgi:uncharacterized protein
LQLPMEPIDYPQTNPGPHTLLAAASRAENTDNLHWLLGRFSGYTGVANFLGAKFLSAPDALQPVLREIAARGLVYMDDGSSSRSLSLTIAKDMELPAVRADLILDTTAGNSMESNLAKLETLARQKGMAIGMASDLPDSVETLARFAKAATARGIMLVPLSAAVRAASEPQNASDESGSQIGMAQTPRVFRPR